MSLVGRLKRSASSSTLSNPDGWLKQAFGAGTTYAGKSVNVQTALGLAPFYRGVQLLSGSVGMLPCKVYEKRADGTRKEAESTSRPWQLLHDKPNDDMAADEFWALVESHLDTWGNAFVWKEYGPDGRVANLWPLSPSRFSVGKLTGEKARRAGVPDGTRYFVIDGDEGHPYFDTDILHIRGLSSDGMLGYSPVHLHRQSLGAALAKDEFAGRFWANDATPGVTLIHPDKIKPDAIDRIKALWDARHRGGPNRARTAVLAENISIHQMTMPLKDAQYIEGQRMDATTQALILGLPPHFVAGDNGGNSLTYSTVEGEAVSLLKFTLSPRLVRIQSAVTHDPDLMPSRWYAEFEPGALLRATTHERYAAWAVAPHLLVDEMREMDNLPPLPDGKGQVLSASKPVAPPKDVQDETGDEPSEEDEPNGS